MAVTNANFGATIDLWVQQTKERTTAVFRSSAQEVIRVMQTTVNEGGNMPVDTGFLRASMQVAVNAGPVPAILPNPNPKGSFSYNASVASLVIAGAEIGDVVTASYSANYAPMIEYGTVKSSPRGFVRLAAAQWQEIVRVQTVRAKNVALDGFAVLSE